MEEIIKRTATLPQDEIDEFQFSHLRKVVNYAWTSIPGYRNLWNDNGFSPDQFRELPDIKRIPTITREYLKRHLDLFVNRAIPGLQCVSTNGTTGTPFNFYQSTIECHTERAFVRAMWQRFVSRKIPYCGSFRTALTGTAGPVKGLWEFDPLDGLKLSPFDLLPKNVSEFVAAIDRFRTPILHGRPASVYVFAKLLHRSGKAPKHKFEAIMLGGELLSPFHREVIQDVFDTKICHWYGHSERAILACNLPNDDRLYVYPQYGFTEIVDRSGKDVGAGESGELVGTGFWNQSMPFIRYRTKDYAQWSTHPWPDQGCGYRALERIEGRVQEFLVGKNRGVVPAVCLNALDDVLHKLSQFRFMQTQIGKVTLCYVPEPGFGGTDREKLHSVMKSRLKDEFQIDLQEVDAIDTPPAGKVTLVDQKLDVAEYL
jgi:phenylacetate-CoA ligase